MRLAVLLLVCSSSLWSATLLRVQCGGPGGIDQQGNVWVSDASFSKGGASWNTAGSLPLPSNHLRFSSPPGAPFSISIPLQPGSYSVTLFFVEPNVTSAGKRVFSVGLNGSSAIANLDLFLVAPGPLKPYAAVFPVSVASAGLQVALTASVGNAVLSGIQVDSVEEQRQWWCESGDMGTGEGLGSLMPGIRHFRSCENMGTTPVRIVRVRVRADGAGAVLDLMTPDSTGTMKSLLVAPVGSSVDGNDGPALPNATYPPGAVLHWMIRVNDSTNPAVPPPTFVVTTVVLEEAGAPVAANKLASIKECSGSVPSWDCSKLLWAKIILADGSPLDLVGAPMVPDPSSIATWTMKQ